MNFMERLSKKGFHLNEDGRMVKVNDRYMAIVDLEDREVRYVWYDFKDKQAWVLMETYNYDQPIELTPFNVEFFAEMFTFKYEEDRSVEDSLDEVDEVVSEITKFIR